MSADTLAMLFPNVAVTRGIAVRVAVSYLAEQSDPTAERWFWSVSYTHLTLPTICSV